MARQLLIDKVPFRFSLTEDSVSGKLVARGQFGFADRPTENRRVYPTAIMEREIRRLAESIAARKVFGECDHPADGKTKLTRVSHLITGLELSPEGEITGSAEVLNTDAGKTIRALYEAGASIGVSSRGYGSVTRNEDGVDVVQDDFQLDTFDFVADPAQRTAYPDMTVEAKTTPAAPVLSEGDCGAKEEGDEGEEQVQEAAPPALPVEGEGSEGASPEQDADGGGLTAAGDAPVASGEADKPRTVESSERLTEAFVDLKALADDLNGQKPRRVFADNGSLVIQYPEISFSLGGNFRWGAMGSVSGVIKEEKYVPGVLTNPDGSCRPNPNAEGVEDPAVSDADAADDAPVSEGKDTSVFLSRKDHDKTIPWSPAAMALAKKAKRSDSLAGFNYVFPDADLAQQFRKAIGLSEAADVIDAMGEALDRSDARSQLWKAYEAYAKQVRGGETADMIAAAREFNALLKKAGGPQRNPGMYYLSAGNAKLEDVSEAIERVRAQVLAEAKKAALADANAYVADQIKALTEERDTLSRAVKDLGFTLVARDALAAHPKASEAIAQIGDLNRFESVEALQEALAPHVAAAKQLTETRKAGTATREKKLEESVRALSERVQRASDANKVLTQERDTAMAKARDALLETYLERSIAGMPQAIAIRADFKKLENKNKQTVDQLVEGWKRRSSESRGTSDFERIRRGISSLRKAPATVVEDSVRARLPASKDETISLGEGVELDVREVERLSRV